MYKFKVSMAGLTVEVNCNYPYTKRFCEEYLSDDRADFAISVSEEEIDEEIAVSEYNPQRGYAESICVYRNIAKRLPLYDRLVFHGAVISYGGRGFLFTAPSGTGKTTHIRLWKKYLDGVEIVNGDKPVLQIEEGRATAWSTPYAGKEGYQNHSSIKLDAICIIHRGKENRIRRITTGEALIELMHQVYISPEEESAVRTLELLDKLFRAVPLYILECDISEEAVRTSFEAMTGYEYPKKGA